jgi:hypothetical protein
MARIEAMEHRLLNWARWKLTRGTGVLGYASVDLTNPTPTMREPYAETPIPTNAIEAAETDDAVNRLQPGGLRLAVLEFYVGRGGVKDKARRLCIGESTLYSRIDQAHLQLSEHFLARTAKARAERQRVELLQLGVRPGGFTP